MFFLLTIIAKLNNNAIFQEVITNYRMQFWRTINIGCQLAYMYPKIYKVRNLGPIIYQRLSGRWRYILYFYIMLFYSLMVRRFKVTRFTFILFLKLTEHYLFMKGSMMHEKFISQIGKKVILDKYGFQNFQLVNINKSVGWIWTRDLRFTSPIL